MESRNPFAAPHFARWWLASMIAGTGVGIQTVTVPIFIRDRVEDEARALAIAAALVAQTLPGAFLTLVGGTLADRIERRRILVRTYALASAVAVVYVALSGLDVRAIWPVFPLAMLVGSAGAFTNPTRQSMLPQLVSRSQLQNAVIFGTMGFMATLQFLGPTVGGLVTEGSSLTTAFAMEVALLAAAALAFGGIRTPPPEPSKSSIVADLVEGLRYVRGEPALRSLLLLATVPGVLFVGPFAVTVPILVPDVFQAGDKWVGLLWGAFGAGVFAGSLTLTLWPLPRRGLALCISPVTGGIMLLAYGSSDRLEVSAAVLFAWGLGASVFINYAVALLQEHADPRMIGRVMSMYSLVFFTALPLGYGQAGLVTRAFGPKVTLLSSGVVATVIGLLALATLRPVRELD